MRSLALISVLLFFVSMPGYAAECALVESVCLEGPGARVIDGQEVERPCWRYRDRYECLSSVLDEDPRCQALRGDGCGQVGSICIESDPESGACVRYEQAFECPGEGEDIQQAVVSCDMEIACLAGECGTTSDYPPNEGFGKSAALLEAMGEVARQLEKDSLFLFTGQVRSCDINLLNVRNCCRLSGWGVDAGLAECGFSEEQLARDRQADRCHHVGTYCANRSFFGVCTRDRQTYCCYGSKLARIIAEQARIQLGRGWGSARRPDCSGFSVEDEIEHLDFSAMDLSEFYDDVLHAIPSIDPGSVVERMEESLNRAGGQ